MARSGQKVAKLRYLSVSRAVGRPRPLARPGRGAAAWRRREGGGSTRAVPAILVCLYRHDFDSDFDWRVGTSRSTVQRGVRRLAIDCRGQRMVPSQAA